MTLSPRVHLLSTQLANQIAAGEVVERPASVLKELLENALDSGATTIRVDIEGGGTRLIRVQDDGCGIHRDDLELALSRHATSKLDKLADLEQISSMGFRGEALASITSVSRCRVVSRTADAETGWCVSIQGSELQGDLSPHAHPQGTTVEVRDLFFNTPARRKFLRSERTEQGHLEDVFKRVALSRFDISFSLTNTQRIVHKLHASQEIKGWERRVIQLCGKAFLSHALHIEFEAAGMRLWGWVATPDFARSQTDLQLFYLNRRTIRDRLVNHAIRQAYQDLLYQGRHPAYVLFLEMMPEHVDVNVHPTKHEVRFREARLVHDFLLSSLQRALDGSASELPVRQSDRDTPPYAATTTGRITSGRGVATHTARTIPKVNEQIAAYKKLHGSAQPTQTEADPGVLGYALAELYGRYILAQRGEQLLLIDIILARECLFRERLIDCSNKGAVSSRPLLLPIRIELDKIQCKAVEQYHEQLQELGFDISHVGPESVMVRQIPNTLRDCDAETFVPVLLSDLAQKSASNQDVIAVIACNAARAVARCAALDDLNILLRDVGSLTQKQIGKRIWVELERAALGKLFR